MSKCVFIDDSGNQFIFTGDNLILGLKVCEKCNNYEGFKMFKISDRAYMGLAIRDNKLHRMNIINLNGNDVATMCFKLSLKGDIDDVRIYEISSENGDLMYKYEFMENCFDKIVGELKKN